MKAGKYTVGLHTNIEESEYHAIDAASSTRIKSIKKSPAHCKALIDGGLKETPALKFGSAFHMATLEPLKFKDTYEINLDIKKSGKPYILGASEWNPIKSMVDNLIAHARAWKLIRQCELVELSGLWIEPESAQLVKFRADGFSKKLKTVFDLKTTTDASEWSFQKSLYDFGYHIQGALYIDGLRALGEEVDHYCIVAVEKTAPFNIGIYRLTPATIEAGRAEYQDLIKTYKFCSEANEWPGYDESIIDLDLPDWAFEKIEKQYGV